MCMFNRIMAAVNFCVISRMLHCIFGMKKT